MVGSHSVRAFSFSIFWMSCFREGCSSTAFRSQISSITVKANISSISNVGDVNMFHGYKEANVNSLMPIDHLDPYTGFPGYKQLRCRIEKVED